MRKRTYGTGTLNQLRTGKWLLQYKPKWAAKRQSKTIDSCKEKAAEKQLSDWVGELDEQEGPKVQLSIEDLITLHIGDMRLRNCSTENIIITENRERKHFSKYFGTVDFGQPMKKNLLKQYADRRLQEKAKRATINRETSALKRMLKLAVNEGRIMYAPPTIDRLDENNIRTGIVQDEGYCKIGNYLPMHCKPVWCFGYRTGVRRGELLKWRWDWLLPYWNEPEPYIKVPGFDEDGNRITKNGKPHTVSLYHPEMREWIAKLLETRNPNCPYIFQYRGGQMKGFYKSFRKARKLAGMPRVIFHDTRRSVITRMEDAKIPRKEAMQMTGHLTEHTYKRYDIGTESSAISTGQKLRAHEAKRKFANKFANGERVINIKKGRKVS